MNWPAFLDKHGIEWIAGPGPNVAAGNVAIQCIFCGESDTSKHLGIHLESGKWSCWRDPTHRGLTPIYLIQKIARCSQAEAVAIFDDSIPQDIDLEKIIQSLESESEPKKTELQEVEFPEQFFRISNSYLSYRFSAYLEFRGFSDWPKLVRTYGLMASVTGDFKDRLICPFYENGKLVGWSGRAIAPSAIRYKTWPHKLGNSVLFNHDRALQGGRHLIVCEGPFDALKLDFYATQDRAVAVLGLDLSLPRLKKLARLADGFQAIVLALDQDAWHVRHEMAGKLGQCGVPLLFLDLPDGVKDPGDLSGHEVRDLMAAL